MEAAMSLILARFLLRCLSFRRLALLFSRNISQASMDEGGRKHLREEIAWAIQRAADRLPGKTVCFPRAIAAQAMLHRRGIVTTLYYGAASNLEGSLIAHVWVQDGSVGVVGMPEPYTFCVVARFPEVQ
jgi:hypothetical protein